MQLNFQIPDKVVEELDKLVDGVRFRNRAQLITVVLADWLATMNRPVDPYAGMYERRGGSDAMLDHDRENYKRAVLGAKYDQTISEGGDVLDGDWGVRLDFEVMRRWSDENDKRRAELESLRTEQKEFQTTLTEELEKIRAELLASKREKGKKR